MLTDNLTTQLTALAQAARKAWRTIAALPRTAKDDALRAMATALTAGQDRILAANRLDLEAGRTAALSAALLDRLTLSPARLQDMAASLRQVADLEDPVGRKESWTRPNGLLIQRVRVPIGVICIIYEARPNVTVDAAGLAFKTGNAVILRGSANARHSNDALAAVLRETLAARALPEDAIQLVATDDRSAIDALVKMNGLIDLVIPRGGADLIRRVVREATVPIIETGVGNCHVYVDRDADLAMAERIIVNAKTQRPGVCNAMESLLVHRDVAGQFLPALARTLTAKGVELRGDPPTRALAPQAKEATEADWGTEYLDLILSVKVVDSLDEALDHIDRYGTRHSEAIVTNDAEAARRFLDQVDAAAVYHNASTRFTDGGEFGFGAEMGISTQKLHARGPVGLPELTTWKYLVEGTGQVRG